MLKRILFFILLSVLFAACKDNKQNESNDIKKIKIETSHKKLDINAIYEINFRVLDPEDQSLDGKLIMWDYCDTTQNEVLKILDKKDNSCSVKFLKKGKVKIKAKVDKAEDTITLKTRSNNWYWWSVWTIIVLGVGFYLGYIYTYKLNAHNKSKKTPKNNTSFSKELKNLTAQYDKLLEEKESYKIKAKTYLDKYNQVAKDYNQLVTAYDELNIKLRKLKKQSSLNTGNSRTSTVKKTETENTVQIKEETSKVNKLLYADCIIDDYFNKVTEEPDEDTVFELHTKNNIADFVIYSGAKRRIIANPAYLDGCEKQIIGDSDVIVDETGIAQIQMDGKWKIINSLKVIIK